MDLTAFLTQSRADRVIELRGPRGATHLHFHLDPDRRPDGKTPPGPSGAIQAGKSLNIRDGEDGFPPGSGHLHRAWVSLPIDPTALDRVDGRVIRVQLPRDVGVPGDPGVLPGSPGEGQCLHIGADRGEAPRNCAIGIPPPGLDGELAGEVCRRGCD